MQDTLSWRSRIKEIRERFNRYSAVLGWLVLDVWKYGRRRLLFVLGASFLSRTLLSSTFVLLILYLNALESGEASWLQYLPEGMSVRTLFWPVAVISSVLFIASSLVDFIVAHQAINISARHSVDVSNRCLAMTAPVLNSLHGFGAQPFPRDTVWISTNGADMLMRATRTMLRMSSPLFQLFYAVLLLLITESFAALAVGLVALPSMILVYLINSKVLENEHQLVDVGGQRKRKASAMAKELAGHNGHSAAEMVLPQGAARDDPFKEAARLRSERAVHKERSQTLSNLVVGIGLLVVMSLLGYDALSGNRSWTTVITFIILMRIAGGSLGGILGSLAFISRLYPALRRFPVYLKEPGFFSSKSVSRLKIKNTLGLGDLEKICLKPGNVYHFYADVPLSVTNLWFYALFLAGGRKAVAADLIERAVLLEGNKADLNGVLSGQENKILQPVLVNAKAWERFGAELQSRLHDCIIVVCHHKYPRNQLNSGGDGSVWIIPAKNGLIGLCGSSWMAANIVGVDEILRRQADTSDMSFDDDEDE